MGGLFRLTIPACPPIPMLGGQEIGGGCIALDLEGVRDRMTARRDRLAEDYSQPPDTTSTPAEWSEWRKQDWLRSAMGRHKEYMRLASAVAEAEDAIRRDVDLEQVAVLLMHGRSEAERWSGTPILECQFVWAECRGCDRRYTPEECGRSDWSRVADPRAGIGGRYLVCPVGHVLFAKQTWVA